MMKKRMNQLLLRNVKRSLESRQKRRRRYKQSVLDLDVLRVSGNLDSSAGAGNKYVFTAFLSRIG